MLNCLTAQSGIFKKKPQNTGLTFWLKAQNNPHILTQCGSLHLFQESHHSAEYRTTDTNRYKWAEANYRPTVGCKRVWMSASSSGHHINVTIYYLSGALLNQCSNIIINIPGFNSQIAMIILNKNLINTVRKYSTYLHPKLYPHLCHCIHQVPAHLQLPLWTGKFRLSSSPSTSKYGHRSHCKPPSTRTSLCWCCQTASYNRHSKITQVCC